jgi:hypothetical protein
VRLDSATTVANQISQAVSSQFAAVAFLLPSRNQEIVILKFNESVVHATAVSLLIGTTPQLSAAEDEVQQFKQVNITGKKASDPEAEGGSAIGAGPSSSPGGGYSPPPPGDGGAETGSGVALGKDPTSKDVRCNGFATADTAATTSKSDATSRYLAAQQLYTAIVAQKNIIARNSYLKTLPTVDYFGQKAYAWSVTYADGGSEQWAVVPGLPATLLIDGNYPGTLVQGSGEVQTCPSGLG